MTPTVSIVIPTYDRPGMLRGCLRSIGALDYPASHLEVVVVDDGSPAPVRLPEHAAAGINVTLCRQSNAGPAAARNTGADRARGRYLAFLDDDCRPEPDWLRRLVDRLEAGEWTMAGGHTRNLLKDNLYSEASQALLTYVYRQMNATPHRARFLTTNNMVVARRDFRAIGGFDERFRTSEDRDLCLRWRASGRRIAYVPDATMRHAHRLTLAGFWRQHEAYGRGAYRFRRKHADTSVPNPFLAGGRRHAARYYAGMIVDPLRRYDGPRSIALSLLVAVSQLASTVGVLAAARESNR